MENQYIEDIPPDVRRELENALDNHESINWLALIRLMPQNSYQRNQIEGFRMETLHPCGSPTRALLNDLSVRRVTLQQLICRLQQLASSGPCPSLQSVLMRLQGSYLIITRQPDELYRHPPGSSLYIKCEASPATGLSYQWFKRKVLLPGKTQSYLHLEKISKEDEGYYICRIALNGQCQFSNWTKVEILESAPELAKPIITTQPQSSADQYVLGGVLHLYCDAVGDPAPTFQWYRNDIPIAGATGREYNKAKLCIDDEGVYLCVASNSGGHAFSNRITIKVGKKVPSPDNADLRPRTPHEQNVSDKVALLIGNKDYKDKSLGKLYHPTNDVCDLAGALRSIGFKVVSLVNLTLSEMRFAVKKFYEMLDKDMYALFYFAGHGFEVGNQSYLMPVDASPSYNPEENLSASEVIKPMQSTEAKLNIVLLDSCRTRPSENKSPTEGLDVKTKNVVIVFPCCSKNSVFESESQTNGFFAFYLLKHIGDNGTISDVIREVSKGIDREDIRDPFTGQKQIVYTHHTLTDELSLKAPINHYGVLSKSTEGWKAAHEIPQSPEVVFKDGDCVLELRFFAEFSNVLLVHALVQGGRESTLNFILEPEILKSEERNGCVFERVHKFEPTLPEQFPRANYFTQAIRIKDLQRLEGDLLINLEVDLPRESSARRVQYRMKTKPLYAKIVHKTGQ